MSHDHISAASGNNDPNDKSLRERMSQDLQLRGMAQRTHDGYLREVRKLAVYFNTPPDRLSEQQVGDYLLHLINDCKFAPGSLRVAYKWPEILLHLHLSTRLGCSEEAAHSETTDAAGRAVHRRSSPTDRRRPTAAQAGTPRQAVAWHAQSDVDIFTAEFDE